MNPTRPVVRWHGGKWRLAPWIVGHFPAHRIYVEPFGGAGSVLMRKPKAYAEVYNDIDGDIVNVFRVLRDSTMAAELRRAIELTPWARAEFEAAYEPSEDPVELARRTIVRCAMAYGSTSRRKYATGFRSKAYKQNRTGAMDWSRWPEQIPAFVDRLKGVTIECRPAADIIRQQDTPETLFYVDPPYMHATRSAFRWSRDCYAAELTAEDHEKLLIQIAGVAGMVVLSGYPHPFYEGFLRGWRRVECQALADGARARTEVLWINPPAAARLNPTLFEAA